MKKRKIGFLAVTALMGLSVTMMTNAKEHRAVSTEALSVNRTFSELTICDGVYAQDINLSGMTAAEAENAINEYVSSFAQE